MKKTKIFVSKKTALEHSIIPSLIQGFENEGNIIYNARNQIRVFKINDSLLNVKRYAVPSFLNRIIYTFFRQSKAFRAFHYAEKLISIGIATPKPIAYVIEKKNGLLAHSYLITEQSPFKRNFYEFGQGQIQGREEILIAFADFTANLHQKGVYHKDFSPGNILFDIINDKVQFSIVDINRLCFGKVSMRKGCRNFARLWGKPDFFRFIAKEYAKQRGFKAETCEYLILKYRDQFWRKKNHSFFEYEESR